MLIGHMRVSTGEQNLDLQQDRLERGGCGKSMMTFAPVAIQPLVKPFLIKTVFLSSPSC